MCRDKLAVGRILSIFEINSYDKDDIIIVREERQATIKETKVMSYILCIIILYSQQLNYGQFGCSIGISYTAF